MSVCVKTINSLPIECLNDRPTDQANVWVCRLKRAAARAKEKQHNKVSEWAAIQVRVHYCDVMMNTKAHSSGNRLKEEEETRTVWVRAYQMVQSRKARRWKGKKLLSKWMNFFFFFSRVPSSIAHPIQEEEVSNWMVSPARAQTRRPPSPPIQNEMKKKKKKKKKGLLFLFLLDMDAWMKGKKKKGARIEERRKKKKKKRRKWWLQVGLSGRLIVERHRFSPPPPSLVLSLSLGPPLL